MANVFFIAKTSSSASLKDYIYLNIFYCKIQMDWVTAAKAYVNQSYTCMTKVYFWEITSNYDIQVINNVG